MKYLLLLLTAFIFVGCVPKQESVENFFQTDSATSIKKDYAYVVENLKTFKQKLNKRNGKASDTNNSESIDELISKLDNQFYIDFNGKAIKNYREYLQIAFSKDTIKNRNDYLILGMYYHIYDVYDIEDGHQITTFLYESQKLEKLYKNLQIIKWKIKVNRDLNDDYLFLTWQNNWQIELEQKIKEGFKPSWNDLQNLKYIKNQQESIFGHSNFSYEVVLTQMIDRVGHSLEVLGITPEEVAMEAIKGIFIFL